MYLCLHFNTSAGVGAMATNCHEFPNIMLPKSLDGDSAPIRFQTDVLLTVKALLSINALPLVLILRDVAHGLWEALTNACAGQCSRFCNFCLRHVPYVIFVPRILTSIHELVIGMICCQDIKFVFSLILSEVMLNGIYPKSGAMAIG